MLIWSDWGILVFVIALLNLIIPEVISKSIGINSNLIFEVGLIISGIICWMLGKRLNRISERVLIDRETGEEIRVKGRKHSLFFIKMEYWAPVLIILGIVSIIN